MRLIGAALAAVLLAALAACQGGESTAPTETQPSPTASLTPAASPSPIAASGKIAYIDSNGNLALMNADGSGNEALTDGGGVEMFRWSPDGSLIAFEGAALDLRVITADGEVLFELEEASGPVWSSLSDRLAVSEGSSVVVYDLSGNRLLEVPDAIGPEWSPDAETLAVLRTEEGGRKGAPLLVEVSSGEERPLSDEIEADAPVYPILWNPAGNVVAFRDGLYDPVSGGKEDLPGVASFWSPDGRLLLVTLKFIVQSNATTGHLLDFSQGGEPIIGLEVRPTVELTSAWITIKRWTAWSADSRYLVYFDPDPFRLRIRIYDTVAIRQSIFRNISGERPSVSPDGRFGVFMDAGKTWLFALDGSVLEEIAEGSHPAWQPGG